jgi:KipI family sensor histidine kinase inhibitor
MGDTAVLAEVESIDAVLALEAAVRRLVRAADGVWAEVADVVAAARTVLLVASPATDLEALGRAVVGAARGLSLVSDAGGEAPLVEIPVRYGGPDLEDVGHLTGLGPEGVVAAHIGTDWRVGFGGFAPGFAYLIGGDTRLDVARRREPRTRVPAGSVGLAGQFSGIYPRESPGGWQLIGTTDANLWDIDRDPPALMRPGAVVRFVDAGFL